MPDAPAPVLAETDAWIAVDKPAGWETIVTGGGDTSRCLASRVRRERDLPGLAPAHRLDRDTTGCQLFGKTPPVTRVLEAAFRARRVEKAYLALCLGAPRNPTGVLRRRLSRWEGGRRPVHVVKGSKGGQDAETAYRLLIKADGTGLPAELTASGCSLMLFHPHTGRTHQIRVHAADFGRPILGDDQYGDRAANRAIKDAVGLARQALHAWRIVFPDPDDESMQVHLESPVPEDMAAAMDRCLPDWSVALSNA